MADPVQRKRSLNIKDARIAGLYDLEHTIGQGHFAVVKLARHVFTGEKVACKIIDKANLDPISAKNIMQEVRCMKLVQHPNIVRLYEVIDTNTKLFLCLELGDYDMYDFISKHEKGVEESLAQQYFCQIITAIDYCHRLHVVHRDLKPENVVFFEKLGMVKLTDFGFSNLYEPGQQLKTSCGSLAYSAPEILLGDAYDAPAVDVWSLGVILYILVCGKLPFQETNDSETLTKILDCKYYLPDHLSGSCMNLIQRMLVKEPPKRANLPEIVANCWVSAGDRGHAAELPLIVQHHLPHSAHTTIIEQMVAGNIGTEDAILSALENDDYSSLTATYFLLAERILSTYREEKAKELMSRENPSVPDEEPIDSPETRASRPAAVNSARCRSRSNSWRARPCSILKEESEEELSSYLKTASRQSSRHTAGHSRDASHSCSSADEASIDSYHSSTDRPSGILLQRVLPSYEDVLSPILENGPLHQIDRTHSLRASELFDGTALASAQRRAKFARTRSSSEPDDASVELPINELDLLFGGRSYIPKRRNSSPSVSMFNGSGKDRISPQAVQDLLEIKRIGMGGRRACSPDSVRSSRSPSPPASSSGRASPAISALSLARLKVAPTTSGGMRKLSSSPHLLGICEEGEEGDQTSPSPSHLATFDGMTKTNRSASTGVVHLSRHGSVQATKSTGSTHLQQTTYSAVRMIRPRHAVVSPDVCRRYEQHQRFIARSRRSTSCSSSEASDDEEGKRLSLISSKYCGRRSDGKDDDDDEPKGNGGLPGTSNGSNPGNAQEGASASTTNAGNSSTGTTSQERRAGPSEGAVGLLLPILEMPQLDSDRGERIRARILHRSHTAERIMRDWAAGLSTSTEERVVDSWLGTPPREVNCCDHEDTVKKNGEQWIRRLKRTRSEENRMSGVKIADESKPAANISNESVDETMFDMSISSSEEVHDRHSDSGCSSERKSPVKRITDTYKPLQKQLKTFADVCVLFDLPCYEKVDKWLRSVSYGNTLPKPLRSNI